MKRISLVLLLMLALNAYGKSFTVATQNLWHYTHHWKERKQNLIDGLSEFVPDIISFQETFKYTFSGKSLFNIFLGITNYNTHFFKTHNVIVVKEGLANASRFRMKHPYRKLLPYNKFFSKRPLLVSTIETPIGEVKVMNLHLSPYPDKKYQRIAQIKYVAKLIKRRFKDDNLIILGDFNQPDDGTFFDPIKDLGFVRTMSDDACTYCADNPFVNNGIISKIDYIFYRPSKLKLVNAQRIFKNHPISDHYGVSAEFELP